MKASGWGINEYDELPGRLIGYFWTHAGGTKLSLTIKVQFSLKAFTAPSILDDQSAPEVHAIVELTRFTRQ